MSAGWPIGPASVEACRSARRCHLALKVPRGAEPSGEDDCMKTTVLLGDREL